MCIYVYVRTSLLICRYKRQKLMEHPFIPACSSRKAATHTRCNILQHTRCNTCCEDSLISAFAFAKSGSRPSPRNLEHVRAFSTVVASDPNSCSSQTSHTSALHPSAAAFFLISLYVHIYVCVCVYIYIYMYLHTSASAHFCLCSRNFNLYMFVYAYTCIYCTCS